jgi:hypothetical protein
MGTTAESILGTRCPGELFILDLAKSDSTSDAENLKHGPIFFSLRPPVETRINKSNRSPLALPLQQIQRIINDMNSLDR